MAGSKFEDEVEDEEGEIQNEGDDKFEDDTGKTNSGMVDARCVSLGEPSVQPRSSGRSAASPRVIAVIGSVRISLLASVAFVVVVDPRRDRHNPSKADEVSKEDKAPKGCC